MLGMSLNWRHPGITIRPGWRWGESWLSSRPVPKAREVEVHSWPGPVHQGSRETSSGARLQSIFSWNVILHVSLGRYRGELATVLEKVAAVWLS